MLTFFAIMTGRGSATHVLVVRCTRAASKVVFDGAAKRGPKSQIEPFDTGAVAPAGTEGTRLVATMWRSADV